MADRARAKRAGFVRAKIEDERKAGAQPATMGTLIDFYADKIAPIIATFRHTHALLEARCLALEQRILELEAQRVITDVNANRGQV